MHGTVVFLGNLTVENLGLDLLASEFGWTFETAGTLDQLRELSSVRSPAAIVFDAADLGMAAKQALFLLQKFAPQALLIPCHRFSDVVNWPELAEAGAFHALALPFKPNEVRQSLGFVWSARLRRSANVLSISAGERRGSVEKCQCGESPCRCVDKGKLARESVA
jgi:DNA-binding NtrC family response regulator